MHVDELRWGAHTADAVRCVILTHADMHTEKCSCVCIIAHNYTPSQIYAYTLFTASTLIRIWWHTERRGTFSGSYISFFCIPAGLNHMHTLLQSHTSLESYKHAQHPLNFLTHTQSNTDKDLQSKRLTEMLPCIWFLKALLCIQLICLTALP